jgi:hypothetical protein
MGTIKQDFAKRMEEEALLLGQIRALQVKGATDDEAIVVAACRLVEALDNKGHHPETHDRIVRRHELEWPTLHGRLSALARLVHERAA